MQTRNDNAKRRPSTSMAGVEQSRAELGDSSMLGKDSETASSNQNDSLNYTSRTSTPAVAKGNSQHAGPHQDQMLIPSCQPFGGDMRELLKASKFPPVTRSTLSELDLNWIMHNISLRVDVNYDHDLHFMPIQGPSGEQKREKAKEYWLALSTELQIYQHNLTECPSCRQMARHTPPVIFEPRLRTLFDTLRELLENLVPDRDHPQISENLDTPLLMQQVEKGVLDIVRLSQWIADLLKSHCAPMRDEWADEMAFKVEEGCANSDMQLIVDGLEKLFSFLEAMKLDVANHQIRTFRFPLIEDTVSFQQGYFGRKIQDRKIRPKASRKWYQKARNDHQKCLSSTKEGPTFEPLGALVHGILKQCIEQNEIFNLPETLAYDRLRIRQLQEDVQDIIYLDICVQEFNNFIRQHSGGKSVSPRTYVTLQWRITTIIEKNSESRNESWQAQTEDVAMEITRAAYMECGFEHSPTHEDFEWTTRNLESALTYDFGSLAHELHTKLEEMAFMHAKVFQDRSPLQVSEAQKNWQQIRQERKLWRADAEDIARRVAHIAVLHWKVWAELVYLGDDEGDTAEGESMSQDEDGLSGLDQILFESSRDSTIEPDWTPFADQTSAVDGKDGDAV